MAAMRDEFTAVRQFRQWLTAGYLPRNVAWIERSEIRDQRTQNAHTLRSAHPDFAALNPGYEPSLDPGYVR
jgi:hypothetical protein